MKICGLVAALSLGVAEVSGHYIFQQLSIGSKKFAVYEHIRKNANYNSPVTSLSSNDLRCNVGGAKGADTVTTDIKAGDAFTWTTDVAVYHQGPISLYMSKAPGSVNDYDGSGDWFKFYDFGPSFSGGQASWPLRSMYTVLSRRTELRLLTRCSYIHRQYPQVHPQRRVPLAGPELGHPQPG